MHAVLDGMIRTGRVHRVMGASKEDYTVSSSNLALVGSC